MYKKRVTDSIKQQVLQIMSEYVFEGKAMTPKHWNNSLFKLSCLIFD